MSRAFLILHGVNGSGLGHWQTLLAQHLRQRGEAVLYPELSGKEPGTTKKYVDL
jgi:predicted alpha/beta hydrolase family esterase